jgi:2,4-dienoyl-CoA reductase-like NADH-dependent reductase (Old Yellow Enzyme family)
LIEPRIAGSDLVDAKQGPIAAEWLRPIFKGQLISACGFEPDSAEGAVLAGTVDAVAFGRHFVSNPEPSASYTGKVGQTCGGSLLYFARSDSGLTRALSFR